MFTLKPQYTLLVGFVILVALAQPAAAFGAGNIGSLSKVEGQNWRHGDIEDALLTLAMAKGLGGKKFNKIMVSRVYFGNWLRDYSQAIDVGTVKSVSAEAIRLLLCVLGFLTFGYGSGEFEVTADRLGCYRPEDHIDNPKDYADNQDARQYDRRLRGPIDEQRELSIDQRSGMKNYIANEEAGIMTSAEHVRKLFTDSIQLARRYKDGGNKKELYESLRLMGTGLHCLEDFFAHSNYIELALREMGERDVFPHVGDRTDIQIEGARGSVFPIVTGTFGGVDFLHSVVGEVSDKMTQNEMEQLEDTLNESKKADTSLLRDLLDKIPDGFLGGDKKGQKIDEIQENAHASQLQNMNVSPREPEEFTRYVQDIFKQVMPVIEFHDDVLQAISAAIEKIPILPKIIEQLEEQLAVFVFSIIAPFIVPLLHQIRSELKTGSEEIIQSSQNEQHIVFERDDATDPTHSMLSKDHFSNILNEVAGQSSAKMLHWVVPQLMNAIDDDGVNISGLMNDIIYGVLHHPAQRELGNRKQREGRALIFQSVKEWWNEMPDSQRESYRRALSRDGVEQGRNHKEGVHDTGHGHGCTGKLKMQKLYGQPETIEDKIAGKAADAIFSGATSAISGIIKSETGIDLPSSQHGSNHGSSRKEDEGGLGGFLGKAGSLLSGVLGDDNKEKQHRRTEYEDGTVEDVKTEYSHHGNKYSQTEHSETKRPDGRHEEHYSRYEQKESSGGRTSGYGYEEHKQDGGRPERHEYKDSSSGYGGRQESSYGGRNESSYGGGYGGRQEESSYGRQDNSYGRQEESSYGRQNESYGGRQEESSYGRQDNSYGRQEESSYGRQNESYGGRQEESSYGRQDNSYGRQEESSYGRQDNSYGRQEESSYGRQDNSYGRQEDSYGSRRDNEDGERREEYGQGGYNGQSGYGGQSGGYGGNNYGSRY